MCGVRIDDGKFTRARNELVLSLHGSGTHNDRRYEEPPRFNSPIKARPRRGHARTSRSESGIAPWIENFRELAICRSFERPRAGVKDVEIQVTDRHGVTTGIGHYQPTNIAEANASTPDLSEFLLNQGEKADTGTRKLHSPG